MKKILFLMPVALVLAGCPFDGDNGKTGGAGETGLQGVQGEQGVTGEQGIQGVAGIQGKTGLACWDLNEDGLKTFADINDPAIISEDINGDTEVDVLDCTGLTGSAGADGKDGDDGKRGAQGEPGEPGDRGEAGAQGDQGIGLQGEPGEKGGLGGVGPRGPDGDTGPTGAKGANGADASVCFEGVYLTGAYMLVADSRSPNGWHSPWLIVQSKVVDKHGPPTPTVIMYNVRTKHYKYLPRDPAGNLPVPWIGSCLQLPPPTPAIG